MDDDDIEAAVQQIISSAPEVQRADTWGRSTAAYIAPLLRVHGVTRPMALSLTHHWLGAHLPAAEEVEDDDE